VKEVLYDMESMRCFVRIDLEKSLPPKRSSSASFVTLFNPTSLEIGNLEGEGRT
jgi:IS5 family transposase